MDLKITSNKENKTIGRKEITFSVFAETAIKRDDLKAELCKKISASPNSTIVVSINSGYGSRTSTGIAHSYETEEALKRYENRGLLERLGIIQKVAKAAAAPAAKAEEKK